MSYIAECLKKFENLPADFRKEIGSLEVFNKIEALGNEYGADFSFLIMLVAIKELTLEQVPEYLKKKYGFAPEDAAEITEKLALNIFTPIINTWSGPELSREQLLEIFQEGLVELLVETEAAEPRIEKINRAIFYFLAEDGLFQNRLLNALLSNQEKLSSSQALRLEERNVAPTVTNWLKSLMQQTDGENLDELKIAQYLSSDPAIRALRAEEKDQLRRLIRIYYNLAFFPNSLEATPLEQWEIIPSLSAGREEVAPLKASEKLATLPSRESPRKPAAPQEVEASKKSVTADLISELELAIKKYPENSLEYKALAQEIKRLKK